MKRVIRMLAYTVSVSAIRMIKLLRFDLLNVVKYIIAILKAIGTQIANGWKDAKIKVFGDNRELVSELAQAIMIILGTPLIPTIIIAYIDIKVYESALKDTIAASILLYGVLVLLWSAASMVLKD